MLSCLVAKKWGPRLWFEFSDWTLLPERGCEIKLPIGSNKLPITRAIASHVVFDFQVVLVSIRCLVIVRTDFLWSLSEPTLFGHYPNRLCLVITLTDFVWSLSEPILFRHYPNRLCLVITLTDFHTLMNIRRKKCTFSVLSSFPGTSYNLQDFLCKTGITPNDNFGQFNHQPEA